MPTTRAESSLVGSRRLLSSLRSAQRRPSKQSKQRLRPMFRHLPFALRIGLAMSFISIAGAMILVYLAVNQHWQLARQQNDAFGQTIAEQLATSLVEPVFTDDYLAIQLAINQLASKTAVNSVALYDADGALLASSSSAGRDIHAAHMLSGVHAAAFQSALSQLPQGYYSAPVFFSGATAAYVTLSIDQSPLKAVFATSSKDLIVAVIAISLLSMFGAYFLSRLLSRPVYRLLEISDAAREGRVNAIGPLAKKSGLRNEWADIFSIYEQLGNEVKDRRELEKLLQQFVAQDVAEQLLQEGDQIRLSGESVEASVLFVDIVQFTRIAESISPDDVASMLNRYLSIFASCARIYRGTVDKFIGDAAMIVFGAPRRDQNHRVHAMACAAAIQAVARQINRKREVIGLNPIHLRIGINSGSMHAGILGSEFRKEFTVVGDSVNLASRLCDMASAGEILLSEYACRDQAGGDIVVEPAGKMEVKGKARPVEVFRLVNAKTAQHWVVTNLIEDIVAQQ